MPVYLSREERELIAKYTKNQRPTYFASVQNKEVEISADMEKFIILMPPAARNNVVSWIQDNNKKTKSNQDRDTLLGEALTAELQDADAVFKEADEGLDNYDKFIDSYFENVIPEDSGSPGTQLKPKRARFGDVVEVGQALSDLSKSVDEFLIIRDRAKNRQVVATVLQNNLSAGTVSKAEQQQVSSWATGFSAYTNGRN